ncbi:DMT family transporter [Streptomyces sp. NPDC054834]
MSTESESEYGSEYEYESTTAAPSGAARPGSEGPPAHLLLTVTMVLWGCAFASSKEVVGQVPHSVAAFLRFGGGALALLVALRLSADRRTRPGWRERGRAAMAGVLGVFVYNVCFFWGLSLAPAMDGSLIIPVLSPVLTSAVVLLAGRETASAGRVAGLVLGLAGAVVFFLGAGGAAGGGGGRLAGDLLFLAAAACWAAFTLLGPRVLVGIEPLRATTYATVAGALLLGAYSAPDWGHTNWSGAGTGVWLNVLFLALGPAALANLLYYRGVKEVGPASASLMMFLVPAIGTLCAAVFLGESFTGTQSAGAGILVAGAVLAAARGRRGGRT